MTATLKKWTWHALRLGVCAAALWWVFKKIGWADLRGAWLDSDKAMVGVAFLIFLPVPIIQSIRFVWMLKAQDIPISYWESIKLSYTGNFFNNFVPAGSVGGDLVKAFYVAQHTAQKTEAVTAVLLDRAVGLLSLALFAAAGLLLRFDDKTQAVALWLGGLLVAMAFGGAIVFSARLRAAFRIEAIAARLPLADQLGRIGRATLRLREHLSITVAALVFTLILQAFVLVSFGVAASALGMKSDMVAYFAYLAIALIVAAIPVSPGGLGTMEAAMTLFLVPAFGRGEQVILLALAMRAIQLFWALPGAVFYLAGACRPDRVKLDRLRNAAS